MFRTSKPIIISLLLLLGAASFANERVLVEFFFNPNSGECKEIQSLQLPTIEKLKMKSL